MKNRKRHFVPANDYVYAACGFRDATGSHMTCNPEKVTCKKCLRFLGSSRSRCLGVRGDTFCALTEGHSGECDFSRKGR